MARSGTRLVVGVGDIHGRFHRVQEWLAALEGRLGHEADLVFAVGDVEAFVHAEDHRRKAAKRAMPAEFADYASGRATLRRELWFIGGNNEDFETLHPMPEGGDLPGGCHYLGRAGVRRMEGLTVAYLSGILAPKHFERPLEVPRSKETHKQAGYFRKPEVLKLVAEAKDVDLLLVHEWPKGLIRRSKDRALRAYRMPWIGSPVTREVMERLRPAWLWAGHSHVPYATSVRHGDRAMTRIACLDQAARPEGSVFWLEFEGREAVRAGWGVSGEVAWRRGEDWQDDHTPAAPATDEESDEQPMA
ncbi:MAG TPA: metallophosphoesterase [Myxococcaceae bacterium]|nr:metallophosphoesterase [Myxococcaceae bacterium]